MASQARAIVGLSTPARIKAVSRSISHSAKAGGIVGTIFSGEFKFAETGVSSVDLLTEAAASAWKTCRSGAKVASAVVNLFSCCHRFVDSQATGPTRHMNRIMAIKTRRDLP